MPKLKPGDRVSVTTPFAPFDSQVRVVLDNECVELEGGIVVKASQCTPERTMFDDAATAGCDLQAICHTLAREAGWWTDIHTGQPVDANATVPTKLMLAVTELAEAMEGWRKGLPDDKLPHRKMLEVELADTVIRVFDLAGALGFNLGDAIAEKLRYNTTRADHTLEARRAAGGKTC